MKIAIVAEHMTRISHIKRAEIEQEREEIQAESQHRVIAAYVAGGPQWVKGSVQTARQV